MGKHKESIKLAIKDELLGRFRVDSAKKGDILSQAWLYDDFLLSLSAKEEAALAEVIDEMIATGIIEYVGGAKPNYSLTEKGEGMLC